MNNTKNGKKSGKREKKMTKLKIFQFSWEDGPCAYNCHEIEVEAVNYSQALRMVKDEIGGKRVRITYRGLKNAIY